MATFLGNQIQILTESCEHAQASSEQWSELLASDKAMTQSQPIKQA